MTFNFSTSFTQNREPGNYSNSQLTSPNPSSLSLSVPSSSFTQSQQPATSNNLAPYSLLRTAYCELSTVSFVHSLTPNSHPSYFLIQLPPDQIFHFHQSGLLDR